MKKQSLLLIGALALAACSSGYHNGKSGTILSIPDVKVAQNEAKITIGDKISGSAECTELFFFTVKSPERQTFGPKMQEGAGNFANHACTGGAIYDAMSKSNADIIVAPHYTAVRKSFLCLPVLSCLYSNTKVVVEGNAGKVSYTK
jgi:hypothetical protein